MPAVREAWTDERLDDLNAKVDRGFDRVDQRFEQVDQRFDQVEKRFDQRFEQVEKRFDQRLEQVDQRLDRVEVDLRDLRSDTKAGFDALQRTLILGFAGIVASVFGAVIVNNL